MGHSLCVGKHKWPASLLIDVQIVHCATDCAIAIVGFASEGQAPLWKIALAPLLAGLLLISRALCNQPPAALVDWAGLLVNLRGMSNRDGMAQSAGKPTTPP